MYRRRKIECTFCGDKGASRAREDVLPVWLAKKLAHAAELHHPGTAPSFRSYTYENFADFQNDALVGDLATKSVATGAIPAAYKLPDVCLTCNGGWMSRLEQGAKLLIPGIMEDKPKVLTPYDQFTFATWALKTCLAYDAARAPRLVPEELGSRRLYEMGYPVPGSHIVIGHDAHHIPEGAFVHARKGLDTSSLSPGVRAVKFGFQFDRLIVQAIFNFADDLSKLSEGVLKIPSDASYLNVLWEPGPRFSWPPDTPSVGRPPEPTSGTEEPVPDATPKSP